MSTAYAQTDMVYFRNNDSLQVEIIEVNSREVKYGPLG